MKSKIIKEPVPKVPKFESGELVIFRSDHEECVILVTKNIDTGNESSSGFFSGVILYTTESRAGERLGQYSDEWNKDCKKFSLFTGQLILTN